MTAWSCQAARKRRTLRQVNTAGWFMPRGKGCPRHSSKPWCVPCMVFTDLTDELQVLQSVTGENLIAGAEGSGDGLGLLIR